MMMADEMIPHLDTNNDGNITLEEFIALPPGEVMLIARIIMFVFIIRSDIGTDFWLKCGRGIL